MATKAGDLEASDWGTIGRADVVHGRSRRLGPECLSDLQLDQLTLGELGGAEADRARLHLQRCEPCERAAALLRDDARQFAADIHAGTVAAALLQRANAPRGSGRRWVGALAWPGALTAAAVLGLIVVAPPAALRAPPVVRAKGADFALSTYVKFAGQDQPGTLHMGQPLGAGDRLQFRVTTRRGGHLAVLAIDSQNEVSVFYPPGATAVALPPARDHALATAVELDEAPGEETIVALLCEEAVAVQSLIESARGAVAGGARQAPLHPGCAEARTVIAKRPAAKASAP